MLGMPTCRDSLLQNMAERLTARNGGSTVVFWGGPPKTHCAASEEMLRPTGSIQAVDVAVPCYILKKKGTTSETA